MMSWRSLYFWSVSLHAAGDAVVALADDGGSNICDVESSGSTAG
jgi:hypothetical protein